jgi:SAM-dependent methyltransferase
VSERSFLRRLVERVPHWSRVIMDRDIDARLGERSLGALDALEISGHRRERLGFRSYRSTSYPEFDVCTTAEVTPQADLVFCEQVLEHVRHPARAALTLFRLTRPGGIAIVSVPFLIRLHREPEDYWRFSASGLRALLEDAGFTVESVQSWGNRASVLANLWFWFPYLPLVSSLRNSPNAPMVVWAIARRPATTGVPG